MKDKASGRIRIALESRMENATLAGLAVKGICSDGPWTPVDVYQIELCVVEAVQNAIRHAYDDEGGKEVEVAIVQAQDRVELSVTDTGRAMAEWPPQGCLNFNPRDISRIPEGGMGLHLILSIMDEVRYNSRNGRNTLTMIRYMPA